MRKLLKLLVTIVLVMILWFGVHTLYTVADGLIDELEKVDVAVVLGNKIELTGEPSQRLKSRLNAAIDLYKKDYFRYVIVSGGVGKEGFDEAVVMKEYMVSNGVPEEVILVDSNGYNTMMTAINAKEIMDRMELDSVMVISQYFHITRSKLAFNKVGIENIYSAHGSYFEIRDVYSIIREFIGYYKYLFVRV